MMVTKTTNAMAALAAILCILTASVFAQTTEQTQNAEQTQADSENGEQSEAAKRVAARSVEMRTMIEGVSMQIATKNGFQPTERSEKALLRTIEVGRKDMSREDGSLWLFSHEGAPVAMVELWVRAQSNWGHTLLLVTSTETIQGRVGKKVWDPPRMQGVEFKAVPKSGKPLKSPRLRTGQMRQIARRFKCNIVDPAANNFSEFRLLTDPIHRYKSKEVDDGAIFAFVRGQTNPEVLLFVESKNDQWQYGFLRCSSNELVARLEKTEVWRAEQIPGWMGSKKGPVWIVHRDYVAKGDN